ncbi:MAG TPA: DUF5685 family protein [Bryobacteraceae bacterium]|nr:DUF5685 family protein [Bryobacteraceae bacterium]
MKHAPRLPYCGTCKTLGAEYGHKTRLLLNNDTVFLAEVLLDLSGVPPSGKAYQSFNCLKLPRNREEIPIALQYAAAITVVLAHFRIDDHHRDATSLRQRLKWNLGARALSPQYRRAAERLRFWRFPLDEMSAILATQPGREANPVSPAHVAEPTMTATAMVFSHGVDLAGRPERRNDAWRLGRKFGELIYFMDAFEDRERDARTGDFNPFLVFPASMTAMRDQILAILQDLEREMTAAHAARLRMNVEERLGLRPRVLQQVCRKTFRDRARDALAFARALRDREHAGFLKGAAVVASAAMLAFAFPHHARQTQSWHQCLGLSMNLMALGTFMARSPSECRSKLCGGCGEGLTECCADSCLEAICESCG